MSGSESRKARFIARDDLLTTKKAAEFTGLPPSTIKYLAASGRLPFEVTAGATRPRRRYRRSALIAIVQPGKPALPSASPVQRRGGKPNSSKNE
jgi:hypothetical protein